jgi:O-antigen/teichoic acid export membrane protein
MTRLKRHDPREGSMKRTWTGRLIKNAVALMISSGGTALIGVAFWGVAAHLASPSAIGRTSAEIAAMVLLANLAQLSFGSIFERFLPVAGKQTRSFVTRAYLMCVTFALVAAVIYVSTGFAHRFLPSSIAWRATFVVAVVMWTLFILQDSALIGLRATKWVPVENILFAVAKLALLPLLIAASKSQGVFLAWSAPVSLAIVGVTWYLFGTRIPNHEATVVAAESLPTTRELIVLAGAQYATILFSVFTPAIVSLVVIQRLGAVANAYYYVPSLIASGLTMFVLSISRSFLVEASHEPHFVRHHAKVTIRAMIVIVVPSVIAGVAFAPQILQIFGTSYSHHGTTLLRMLLLALPGSSVTIFYTAFAWLDKRVWWMALRGLFSVIIYFVVLFAFIGHYGILAIGIASLVSSGIQGTFFLPVAIVRYRRTVDLDRAPMSVDPSSAPEPEVY